MSDTSPATIGSVYELKDDPLQLRATDPANAVRFARAAPHPDIERIYRRLTSGEHADAHEMRLVLLAHLILRCLPRHQRDPQPMTTESSVVYGKFIGFGAPADLHARLARFGSAVGRRVAARAT